MELSIGIVGAGSFAGFAATAFLKVPGIRIVAVTDIDEIAAEKMAGELNATVHTDYGSFLANSSIDLVYIATPPFLHYRQSKMALEAGKHVICEKPAALRANEAEELSVLARSLRLLYIVNLMQRYNPMFGLVKKITDEKILGSFLHGFFENYASDEKLSPGHWFWDITRSGGIFIEHGIHFFDLFAGWLGEGKIVNAIQLKRPGVEEKIIDRVQATVLYKDAVVNFYHGFDQPGILDRQEMRLQFEQGDITLYGWIPVEMHLYGIFKKEQLENFCDMVGDISIIHHNKPSTQKVRGRYTDIFFTDQVTLKCGTISEKEDRYREMLTAMIQDQWQWIINPKHQRVIDDCNAVQSLRMSEEATVMAQLF